MPSQKAHWCAEAKLFSTLDEGVFRESTSWVTPVKRGQATAPEDAGFPSVAKLVQERLIEVASASCWGESTPG